MSTSTLSIGIFGTIDFDLSGVDRFFDRFESGLTDMTGTPLGDGFMAAGDSYMSGARSRFGQFSQGGGSWPPLSPKYAAWKMKKLGHNLIGVKSGHMLLSLYPGQPDNVRFPLPDGVVVGTDDPKARFFNAKRIILVDPADPSMPSTTFDNIIFDIEKGFQGLIDQSASGVTSWWGYSR
jgi:hypothetical protein